MITPNNKDLPAYLSFVYGDLYQNPKKCAARDNRFSCWWRTFFLYNKLVYDQVSEIKERNKVLQFGLTFGNQIDETAMAVGRKGKYDIIDVNSAEVSRVTEKYWEVYPCLSISKQDASKFQPKPVYDVVICFMLLSIVPSATKTKIINNALKSVKPKGKVIFVDWHNPWPLHPLRYIVRMYNRLHHPFVERLWDRQISSYAEPKLRGEFMWHKKTYFSGMFQKLVATRKESMLDTLDIVDDFDGYAFDTLKQL